jgi:hypothetical protein
VARVYSTRFLFGESETGVDVSYTVPAGFVAVLRDVSVSQVGDGAGNLTELIVNPPSGDGLVIVFLATNDAGTSVHYECRVVLEAGDTLLAASEGPTSCHVIGSGYLLSLP